ncbi:unnamed protein product [Brassica rapa subsp. narinosa]
MDKQQASEETTWVPQTPIKPITPIYPDQIQTEERRFAGNKDKSGLDHLSFGDLLALANNASSVFLSRQSGIDKESVIKTPEKPKRKKHRPKVVREAKPKRDIKPKTPKKPAAAVEGEESKTPKRKYVRKKKEAGEDQEEYTPVEESSGAAAEDGEASDHDGKKPCRRALEFDDQSLKPQNGEAQHRDETKQDQDLQDYHMAVPSTPKRKRSSQSRRMGKEMKNNEAQATKRRQGKEPTRSNIYFSGQQYEQVFADNEAQWLFSTEWLQKGMRSRSTTGQQLVTQENVAAFDSDCRVLTFQGRQSFESNAHLDKIETPTKKRTTGHARFRCLSSTNKASEQSQVGWYSRQTQVASSRKKRTTKSQTKQLTLLPNHCHFPPSFAAGLAPEAIWQQRHSIEAISELMRLLDINREYSETALVPYGMNSSYSVGNQIVIFNGGGGAIVPSTRVKKPRRERAKVHIDNETDRVWKLLMESIDSEGVDGSDEKKAKWWEEERNVFRGRADSFIARMHLVQGDRRFTPWKGSVVDSVVGVFLTQNVSDHLSSSAFMSLAAEYPVPFVPSSDFEVGESSMPSIRITYLDSDEPISNPPVPSETSSALDITQPDEEKEYVNSNDTSRSSSEIASSGNESAVKTTDSKAQVDSDRTGSSVEVNKTVLIVQELFPSEDSVLTCQNSLVSETPKKTERAGSSSEINSEAENCTHFVKLLESQGSAQLQEKESDVITADTVLVEEASQKTQCSSSPGSLQISPNTSPGDCSSEVKDFKSLKGKGKYSDDEPCCFFGDFLSVQKPEIPDSSSSVPSTKIVIETPIPDINESTNCLDVQEGTEKQQPGPDSSSKKISPMDKATFNADGKKILKEVDEEFDWDSLRREAEGREGKREKTARSLDSVDWEAIRTADVNEVAETIKSRGMNHKLAERIQGFLNRLLTDHGSLDLEWLRDVPPDKAKEYLLSFNGLGLKSVECVRLLTLHHLAFPVDTNVGRIAVRLGWVPLQPLPESLQLHLLEMYPVLESIQKYLWPRLCKFDQKTLYELHYQMITFGKVFCTKSKPNCNACPMRGECRHFASAFASARFALPGPEKGMERPDVPLQSLPEPLRRQQGLEVVNHSEAANRVTSCEPIIEVPASPEPECAEVSMADIEDAFFEDPEEIPTIRLNMDAFTNNLKKIFEHSKELQDGNMSGALVALTAEAASLPMPKLKNISQLRTEHQVYELKDDHPLLAQFEKRETDDPCSYLLAIWTPGETVDSIQPTRSKCIWQEAGKMCNEKTCFSCNNIRETQSQTVRGTILVPCRTAMRGSFPLNGTYFQVNEVFADHESSLTPIDVPRDWLWDLARRTVYFGTSIPSIFKGLSTETIQQCFWRGYVCVRGFDRQTRAPRPLIARLHFPKSKMKSQMENSRRAFDRSRDPGPIKKPRLSDESIRPVNSNARQFPSQRPVATAVGALPASSRFRAGGGREAESSSEAYEPQLVHPHYELVNQYKSALSELTFNSKPIITNLTIIAGENVHAAKAVVSTICNNIIEVPSDQKLPTLYLLDSIVKNIGRDYIKYFAARLPEVFVKAYRQVDPPMRSNMRHLFGTWKGVFHPQILQQIEKELGFNAKSDGSVAAVTTGRADLQSQRPPNSIHVNPKYLERQRLQQSGRTKVMVTDVPEIASNLTRDPDRLERVSSTASGGLWAGPAKVNTIRRPQKDSLSEPLYEKDMESISEEYEYASDLPHNSRSVVKKVGPRITEDGSGKQWYEALSRSPDLVSDQREGLHTKSRVSNYATARLENSESSGPSRNIGVPYDSWKNSEEEEFMWDMHSRVSETDVATINPKIEFQASDESERLESKNHLLKRPRYSAVDPRLDPVNSYSREQKDSSILGPWTSSPRSLHDSEVFPSISAASNAARKGIQPQSRIASSGILPISGPVSDKQSKQNVSKQDSGRAHSLTQRDPRASRFPAKSQSDSVRPLSSSSQFKNTNTLELPDSSQVEKFDSKSTAENARGQANMNDLLAAVMKSGILSNNATCGGSKEEMSQNGADPRALTLSAVSKDKTLPTSVAGAVSLTGVTSAQASKENSKASDPISSLLSSLVSKGLISASKPEPPASKTELPSLAQCAAPSVSQDHSPDHSTSSSMSVVPSDAQPVVLVKKSLSTASKVAPVETAKPEPENLIGLKFRADKIRELHPSVISSLFDDLPHLCISCGVRLKQKEELDRHMEELHDKKKLELNGTNSKCRVWFPKADDWIAAKSGELEPEYEEDLSEPESAAEDGPAIAADENQSACILCGEMFEEYFSQEVDQWMFKGASYLTIPPDESEANGPIVHAACLTKSSLPGLGVGNAIKQVKGTCAGGSGGITGETGLVDFT